MMKSTTWMASLLTVVVVSANAWAQTVSPPESVGGNGPASHDLSDRGRGAICGAGEFAADAFGSLQRRWPDHLQL